MANYTKVTDFRVKDRLPTSDPNKIVRGTELEVEFDAIAAAINSKADAAGAIFTGTTIFENVTVNNDMSIGGTLTTTNLVVTGDSTFDTLNATDLTVNGNLTVTGTLNGQIITDLQNCCSTNSVIAAINASELAAQQAVIDQLTQDTSGFGSYIIDEVSPLDQCLPHSCTAIQDTGRGTDIAYFCGGTVANDAVFRTVGDVDTNPFINVEGNASNWLNDRIPTVGMQTDSNVIGTSHTRRACDDTVTAPNIDTPLNIFARTAGHYTGLPEFRPGDAAPGVRAYTSVQFDETLWLYINMSDTTDTNQGCRIDANAGFRFASSDGVSTGALPGTNAGTIEVNNNTKTVEIKSPGSVGLPPITTTIASFSPGPGADMTGWYGVRLVGNYASRLGDNPNSDTIEGTTVSTYYTPFGVYQFSNTQVAVGQPDLAPVMYVAESSGVGLMAISVDNLPGTNGTLYTSVMAGKLGNEAPSPNWDRSLIGYDQPDYCNRI